MLRYALIIGTLLVAGSAAAEPPRRPGPGAPTAARATKGANDANDANSVRRICRRVDHSETRISRQRVCRTVRLAREDSQDG